MHDGPVVSNNTPLVALWTVGQLPLLRDLFGSVLIPPAVGVLLLAKEAQLIPAVTPVLRQLLESGLFLSDELCRKAIRLAGES